MAYSTRINDSLFRVTFPYKDIYTTVCVLRTPQGDMVVDLASYDSDMEEILFPALKEIGVTKESLKYALITHKHVDHAGGVRRFLEEYPDVVLLTGSAALQEEFPEAKSEAPEEGQIYLGCLRVVNIPGHTVDAMGVVDDRRSILVCGDCLQQYGIYGSGKWGSNIRFPEAHLKAVEKLRSMNLKGILGAHDFHPVGWWAEGDEVEKALFACEESLQLIRAHLLKNETMTDEELEKTYNATGLLPTVGKHVFAALREMKA